MVRRIANVTYTLTYKDVKNINLRIQPDLTVAVSANRRIPVFEIDNFVDSKSDWINAAMMRTLKRKKAQERLIKDYLEDKWDNDGCLTFFEGISDRIYPIFEKILKDKPLIKVRFMKSRWGVCHPYENYITLNKMLMDMPVEAVEYVVLHEYVHFLHHDHQKGFHNTMKRLMPDYKERRKLLK